MLFEALLNKGTLPLREGFQSGQMGRAVNPLTSVFESSNLSPSTKLKNFNNKGRDKFGFCGCSSMVER